MLSFRVLAVEQALMPRRLIAGSFFWFALLPGTAMAGAGGQLVSYLFPFLFGASVAAALCAMLHRKRSAAEHAQLAERQLLEQQAEKLKSDLRLYSTILNMVPVPIWQRREDLAIRYCNLAYTEIAEEFGERSTGTIPELDGKSRALAKSAFDSAEPKSERRHLVIDGQRRYYQLNEFPMLGEKLAVGMAQDITELEELDEELKRHISAQGDLLESSASAMAIFGPDMRLKSFNYAYVALWKLDEQWLESQPSYGEILEALREKRKLPEQANFKAFKEQQLRLFKELIEPREEFFYLPDGKALRVIDIPHALGGILFAYEDVTDRLALERSYNTLIAVQNETLDNLQEGVAVFGEDGRLKLSNPVYLKMWQIDKAFAETEPHMSDVIEKCKPLFFYENWEETKRQRIGSLQERKPGYSRVERTDGKVIDCSSVPLPDGGTLITYLDVTDSTLVERSLREKNEALQESDRLKSEFLANVSYELRSPLTSIIGFSDMLQQDYFGDLSEKQREYVEGIHQSSQHLMQIINDILDLASIEAGYMQLEVSRFDILSMMSAVLSLTQERVKEYNITVTFECPAKIGKMLGDETRIRQALFNLLSNAIKYTEPGGVIVLGACEQGKEQVVLWVEDEGPGISEGEREKVFEKFYRGSSTEKQKSKIHKSGTGLGLSIVKSFIQLHGGSVSLESGKQKGTKVLCTLPRSNPELQVYLRPKRGSAAA